MPIDREKVQANAQKFVDKKKYDKAVAELLKITQEDPNDARTLLKIGDLYSKMADYPNAIATYERVGKHYATNGFANKAIAVYKQIREMLVKHAPQLEDRYAHITPILADLFQQLGNTPDALAALDEIANRLQRQQKDVEALDVLRRIVELDPTNPLPHLRLAEALSRMKDAEGAVEEFGGAASLLVTLGRRDDAIKVFERLLHLKPDVAFAHQCAELYLERGAGQDGMLALAKLQLCFQADPKNLDTLALLARAFGAIGQASKGIEVQKEMARLAKEQGQMDLFHQLIEKLLRVAPHDEQVRALAVASSRMPAAAAHPSGDPVIREAQQDDVFIPPPQPSEPSYAPVDSRDFVDDSEIEEVSDDYTGAQAQDDGIAYSDDVESAGAYLAPEAAEPEMAPGDYTAIEGRPRGVVSEPPVQADDAAAVVDAVQTGDDDEEIRQAVAQVLADAAAFRRVRLFGKALEALQTGLELDPMCRQVHEACRDVLVEMGSYVEAAGHVVVLAGMQLEDGDVDDAVQALYDALSLCPGMTQAAEMLQSLGYELPDYGAEAPLEPAEEPPPQEPAPDYSSKPPTDHVVSYATEPPLPAYPMLDELPPPVMPTSPPTAAMPAFDTGESPAVPMHPGLDEPFGVGDAPLPSFPMTADSEQAFDLAKSKTSRPPPAMSDTGAVETAQFADLEDVLDEADFFASRGLFEDARAILTEQLATYPRHVLLNERLAELDAQEQAARDAGAEPTPSRAPPSLDRSFDIAASLDAIENLDATGGMASAPFEASDGQVDVEEVFAAFKEGVAKQVSVDDAQSHYDLGLAYKEMGLLEDAVHEFDIAANDEARECICRSMVGMIQMERGKVAEAVEAFQKALAAPVRTPEQETVLCYDIGSGLESLRRPNDALVYFQKVAQRDAGYRDVADRIRRLSGLGGAKGGGGNGSSNGYGGEDLDRAFDDILGGGPQGG